MAERQFRAVDIKYLAVLPLGRVHTPSLTAGGWCIREAISVNPK